MKVDPPRGIPGIVGNLAEEQASKVLDAVKAQSDTIDKKLGEIGGEIDKQVEHIGADFRAKFEEALAKVPDHDGAKKEIAANLDVVVTELRGATKDSIDEEYVDRFMGQVIAAI